MKHGFEMDYGSNVEYSSEMDHGSKLEHGELTHTYNVAHGSKLDLCCSTVAHNCR